MIHSCPNLAVITRMPAVMNLFWGKTGIIIMLGGLHFIVLTSIRWQSHKGNIIWIITHVRGHVIQSRIGGNLVIVLAKVVRVDTMPALAVSSFSPACSTYSIKTLSHGVLRMPGPMQQ